MPLILLFSNHWYLAVVLLPSRIISSSGKGKERLVDAMEPREAGCQILIFDSLGGNRAEAIGKIRRYSSWNN